MFFKTALKDGSRERAFLLLTLLVAPLFILVYRLIFLQGMIVYHIGMVDTDTDGFPVMLSTQLEENPDYVYSDGSDLFELHWYPTQEAGERAIRGREIYVLVIPGAASAATEHGVNAGANAVPVTLAGDFSDPYYLLASTALKAAMGGGFPQFEGSSAPFTFGASAIGFSGKKTPFENYVPGLLVVSSLAGIYLFSIVLARERESIAGIRYRLAGIRVSTLVLGKGGAFILLSLVSCLLSFASAHALGFGSAGSMAADLFVGIVFCTLCSAAVVGIAFGVAAFARNVFEALSIATVPFFITVFFSGAVYPLPEFVLFTMAGTKIRLFDFLPSTHAVRGLRRTLTFGIANSGCEALGSLAALFCIAVMCLTIGGLLYKRRVLDQSA
jgi:hypothetical protein